MHKILVFIDQRVAKAQTHQNLAIRKHKVWMKMTAPGNIKTFSFAGYINMVGGRDS